MLLTRAILLVQRKRWREGTKEVSPPHNNTANRSIKLYLLTMHSVETKVYISPTLTIPLPTPSSLLHYVAHLLHATLLPYFLASIICLHGRLVHLHVMLTLHGGLPYLFNHLLSLY